MPPTGPRRSGLLPVVGAVLGLVVSLLLGPTAPSLGEPVGDEALGRTARQVLEPPEGYGAVSVLRIRDGETTWAGFPAGGKPLTADTPFELGSVTKTFTGLLLADAVDRGEVRLEDGVGKHLPELAGTVTGEATLEDLATHRAGLPSIANMTMGQVLLEDLAGVELAAYSATTRELYADTLLVTPDDPGTYAYSNLGVSLLGHALARAGGAPDWPSYVDERLFDPLGMDATRVIAPGDREPQLATPHLSGGREVAPWTGDGYAPAGVGVVTTATDLGRFAQALIDATAPGMAALQPRQDMTGPLAGAGRVGLVWMVSGADGEEIAWHNGGTGGTRAMLAVNRAAGEAVVVLNGSRTDVTGAGLQLIGVDDGPPRFWLSMTERDYYWFLGLIPVLLFAVRSLRAQSRAALLGGAAGAVGGVILIGLAGPWNWVPGWILGVTGGVTVGGIVAAARRWRSLPWWPKRRVWLQRVLLLLGLAFLLLMLGVAVWAWRGI